MQASPGRAGIALRRCAMENCDVAAVRGMRATSIVRTIGERGMRLELIEAVVIADAALHSARLHFDQLTSWADAHGHYRGILRLRRLTSLVDSAAESPMESRLRMVIILGGLPPPKAQITIRDRWARRLGRPDLYYPDQRLGIEYDGATHRDSLAEDNRRQNRLLNAGVRLLRFTASDVLHHPDFVVAQVRQMLVKPPTAGARGLSRYG